MPGAGSGSSDADALNEKAICLKFLNLLLHQPVSAPDPIQVNPAVPPPSSPPSLNMSLQKSNLLPNTSQGFTSQAYWNAFFEKKTEGFEWLALILHRESRFLKYELAFLLLKISVQSQVRTVQ